MCVLLDTFVLSGLCAEFVQCAPFLLSCADSYYCMCASSLFHLLKNIQVVVKCCHALNSLHLLQVIQPLYLLYLLYLLHVVSCFSYCSLSLLHVFYLLGFVHCVQSCHSAYYVYSPVSVSTCPMGPTRRLALSYIFVVFALIEPLIALN